MYYPSIRRLFLLLHNFVSLLLSILYVVALGVPIDNDDTLHGLFRDLQKRLRTSRHTTGDPLPAGGFVYDVINQKPELMIPISKAGSSIGQDKFVTTVSSALTWATNDVANKDSEAETVKALLGFLVCLSRWSSRRECNSPAYGARGRRSYGSEAETPCMQL
jgi:hypothetical protein